MTFDVCIAGGGIVGLATAYNLLDLNPKLRIAIVEKEGRVGAHQTSHNSGVIHSGIYYKPGSLKAQNCVRGYAQLLEFCDKNEIKYDLCGKIIVATAANQLPQLEDLYRRGVANGLANIKFIKKEEINEFEPHVSGLKGIFVPQTGIIDFLAVSEKLKSLIEQKGGEFFFDSPVENVISRTSEIDVICPNRVIVSKSFVNCCGLQSDRVAQKSLGDEIGLRIIPFRGEYYFLKPEKQYLVKNLIYPVPDPAFPFLGVHFTRTIDGKIEAGPNAVFSFAREGYSKFAFSIKDTIDSISWPGLYPIVKKYWRTGLGEFHRSFSKAAFTAQLQKLIPEIQEADIYPGGAGVRAQACSQEGALIDDFAIISRGRTHNLCNAPSPAATSSLSVGRTLAEKVLEV